MYGKVQTKVYAFLFSALDCCKWSAPPHPSDFTAGEGTRDIRGLLEKYPTFGREKETGLLGALDT